MYIIVSKGQIKVSFTNEFISIAKDVIILNIITKKYLMLFLHN